jgi:tetrahydromethanopterin S-methyltransferase subunit G
LSVVVFVWAEAVKIPGEKHVGWDVDVGDGLNVGVSIIVVDQVVGDDAELRICCWC